MRLPSVEHDSLLAGRLRALAGRTALLAQDGEPVELDPRFVLTADAAAVGQMLRGQSGGALAVVAGALPESFVAEVARQARRRGREIVLVVADSTKVFLTGRGPAWYARQGARIQTLDPISLRAITVNPVAPQSHSFDSAELRACSGRRSPTCRSSTCCTRNTRVSSRLAAARPDLSPVAAARATSCWRSSRR